MRFLTPIFHCRIKWGPWVLYKGVIYVGDLKWFVLLRTHRPPTPSFPVDFSITLTGSNLTMISFFLIASSFHLSLSPSCSSNCLIILDGTVVLRDPLFLFALFKLVICPFGIPLMLPIHIIYRLPKFLPNFLSMLPQSLARPTISLNTITTK